MQEKNSQNANNVISRLKSLLKLKTDIQLSEFLNIKPNTISTWKKRNSLDYETVISICDLYELDLNEIFLDKKSGTEISGATPLITKEVQFQYAAGADRKSLMELVPKFSFPFIDIKNSQAFQVVSNNMFPLIDENSFVVCSASSLAEVKDNKVAVIVTKTKGIFLNRVSPSGFKDDQYVLTSDNDFYNEVTLNNSEIAEVWMVKGVLSYDVNSDSKVSFINDSLKKIDKFMKKNEITD
ncbi:LexA family transcriptional regulator [Flavobacterium selenitireducens]|uniref:LexA family transcriptional regulator n=1 Tax=Flavobacterium selenitireducens TaxID=2722704 RepID=UPI00168A804C|nr:helix-turn-helix domain-containing protein [Flavobacterium selenitireducens]MBD3581314.1 bacteriophage CI repressor [Flavobacterium selenitireducens]